MFLISFAGELRCPACLATACPVTLSRLGYLARAFKHDRLATAPASQISSAARSGSPRGLGPPIVRAPFGDPFGAHAAAFRVC